MFYELKLHSNNGTAVYNDDAVSLIAESDSSDTQFSLSVTFAQWDKNTYIFMPACVYDGNAFEKIPGAQYPPMYRQQDCKADAAPVIAGNIPALEPDKSGKIEITAGDMSVPCFGAFFAKSQKAFFLFTEQLCKDKNIGFSFENGQLAVMFPVIRSKCYRQGAADAPSEDSGICVTKGERVFVKVRIKEFACRDIPGFFELFFKNRRCLLSDPPAQNGYTQELWDLMERHMNSDNFSGEYYAEMSKKWQCGWVGGGMSSLPLWKHGNALSRQRSVRTIDFMTSHLSPAGFFTV